MIKEGISDERVFELLVLVSLIGMGCHHMYNPVAQFPIKTLFPEAAHVMLGHTAEADFTDTERTPKSLREVEAEAVAFFCCEALNLEVRTTAEAISRTGCLR
jgi:hypothetical protein